MSERASERARTQEKETNGVDGKESTNRVAITGERREERTRGERKSDRSGKR